MALENVLATIRREAEEHAESCLAAARDAARGIEAAARERADALRKKMEVAAEEEGARIHRRRVQEARLDALRETRAARERVFATALSQVRAELRDARSRPQYAALFAALVAEAETALPDAVVMRIDPRDAALAPHAESTIETWGGVELEAADGRIVRNTLEERLRRAEPELRRLAAHALGLA